MILRFDKWLTNTYGVVPDNDMDFHVPKADERGDIIQFLRLSSENRNQTGNSSDPEDKNGLLVLRNAGNATLRTKAHRYIANYRKLVLAGLAIVATGQQMRAQQANAEGITILNASGDTGAAGGAFAEQSRPAKYDEFPMFLADVPEVTGVGGTQFQFPSFVSILGRQTMQTAAACSAPFQKKLEIWQLILTA